jgi:hypothetical protein
VSLCPEPEQLAAERLAENFSLHPKPSIRYSTKAIKLFGCCDLPRSFEVIFLQFFEVFSALEQLGRECSLCKEELLRIS